MNWLNLETATLDAEEFVGAEPIERATWLCLLRYCIGQENGGVIEACKDWSDRKWQQLARITKAEVEASSELWAWEGDCLRVWSYPVEKQTEVQHRRERSRVNGLTGGRPSNKKKQKPTGNPEGTQKEPTLDIFAKAEGEEKEKEKEKEKENTILAPAEAAAAEAAQKPRNELLDALASLEGDPLQTPKTAWGKHAKVLAELREICPTLTPQEIARRAANYRTHHPDVALTSTALRNHWAKCEHAAVSAKPFYGRAEPILIQ